MESGIRSHAGYEVKGVPDGRAKIIVAAGNFHGRTTTIISFSTIPTPAAAWALPQFITVPYGDLAAMRDAMTDDVVAVLIEPIREAGVRSRRPTAGLRELTRRRCC